MEFICKMDGVVTLVPICGGAFEDANEVDCLMSMMEPLCYDVICEFLPDGARAAEIGCFKGGSACVLWNGMRRRNKRVDITCHDLFEPFDVNGKVHDIEKIFDANIESWKTPAIKVKGDSKKTCEVHRDGSLDYVFVDGDHSYEGALADIRNFLPKLKKGGWMFIQDGTDGVKQAVEDAIGDSRLKIVIDPPVGHYVNIIGPDDKLMEYCKKLSHEVDRVHGQDPAAWEHMTFGTA